MLKKRIIANLIVKDKIVVQSFGFHKYLPVGKPDITVEFLNKWGIDEIILTDISASISGSEPDYDMIRKVSEKSFTPLTVGGGITKLEQIRQLMHCGADKIVLNQSAYNNPVLITEAANIYGNQCVVVSIDSLKTEKGYEVYDYLQKKPKGIKVEDYAEAKQKAGAGEILINSIERDGSYIGYDLQLVNEVCSRVSIPVIACGGAKDVNHIIQLFKKTNASAASVGNSFHFIEHSVIITKSILKRKGFNVRIETHANYLENNFDDSMRVLKKEDLLLEELLFIKTNKEVI